MPTKQTSSTIALNPSPQKDAVHSVAEREAVQSRFYSFAPSFSAVGLEQMIVLHAFEELMGLAQPERTWNFSDRTLRERIPAALVGENLHAAFQLEPFVNSTYVPRYDCLLLALHLRSPPGRHVWHTWCGDLLSNPEAFGDTLLPKPTFNDWSRIFGTSYVPSSTLVQLDARTFGYAKAREKLVTPSDGSAILVTTLSRGLENSFPRAEGETFEPEPLCSSRFARVMKNGLGLNEICLDIPRKRSEIQFEAIMSSPQGSHSVSTQTARLKTVPQSLPSSG